MARAEVLDKADSAAVAVVALAEVDLQVAAGPEGPAADLAVVVYKLVILVSFFPRLTTVWWAKHRR